MWSKRSKIFLNLSLSVVLSACGVAQNSIEAKRAGGDLKTVVHKITPIAAKPNEIVNLSGRNFYDFKNLRARVETTSGSTTDVPLNITDSRNASFIMPTGAGLGVKNVTLVQGTAAIEAGKFNIIADQTDNALPIWIGDASEICTTKQYIDRNGDTRTGTKDCSAGGAAPVCEADGVVGCVTTVNFKSAATAGAASKILSGQTLAGVPGNVLLPDSVDVKKDVLFGINSATTGQLDPGAGVPASCSSENQTNCVATTNFPAVDRTRIVNNTAKILSDFSVVGVSGTLSTCAADGSNCFIPTYSVMSQPLKAINYNSIDAAKMLSSLTISDVVGSIVSRESWDLTTAFPGVGYYTGTSNQPSGSTIATGTNIVGVSGLATLKPADCAADGGTGCVTTADFPAAQKTGAASKILSGQTLAGVSGNVTLPGVGKVLTGTTFGVGGNGSTGTLTLPSAANVLSGSGTYGDPGALMTPALADRGTWNLTTTFPGAGYYSGTTSTPIASTYTGTLFGTVGTAILKPADCSANGATGCVTTSTYRSADLSNLSAGNIKSSVTIAGVTGEYPSASYPLVSSSVLVDDLSDVQGTREGQLRSATNFEFFMSDGTRVQAQGDADIVAANIASSINIFGQAGGATLSPANCSSNGQQSCVATGSYFAGTACAANGSGCYLPSYVATTQPLRAINFDTINSSQSSIRSTVTLGGVTGTLADCTTNGSSTCVATSSYPAGQLRGSWDMTTSFPGAGYYSGTTNAPTAGDIRSTVTIAGVTGNYPSVTSPLAGASGTDLTSATFSAQIKSSGTFQYFGSDGTRYTGTGDADIVDTNIKSGVSIFGTIGTYGVAPDPWDVRVGKTINGVAGRLKVNCRNRVRTAVYNYDNPGTFAIPTTGVFSGSAIDIWDTIDDYNNNVSGLPTSIVTAWETSPGVSNTDCGGVETAAGDANVWRDVTTTAAGASSNCTNDSARCTMQDKITGLWWSKLQASGAWNTAWNTCQTTLNASGGYNGQTGWRLPTQKELLEAYIHGIKSAVRTNWMTESDMAFFSYFWSGSSVSGTTNNAWYVHPANGRTSDASKTSAYQVVCVR